MTLSDLGNIGELIGAIAVVISLLYLAVQVRHSSQVSKFEAHRNLSDAMATVLGEIAASEELYQIWKTMTETPEQANDDQRERFGMLLHRFFTVFSDAHRLAVTDPQLSVRYKIFLARFLVMPAVRSWWQRQGPLYSEPFKSLVDAMALEAEAVEE